MTLNGVVERVRSAGSAAFPFSTRERTAEQNMPSTRGMLYPSNAIRADPTQEGNRRHVQQQLPHTDGSLTEKKNDGQTLPSFGCTKT